MHIRPRGLLGTWVKYNQNYFYLYPFWGSHLQVRHVNGFLRMIAQTTRTRARMCLLGSFSHCTPFKGSQTPKNPNFGGNMRFQAKLAKSKNVYIIKTTAPIPTKFFTVIKTTKLPSWLVPTHVLEIKMADRKSKNCYNSAAVRAILTKCGTMMQFYPLDHPYR